MRARPASLFVVAALAAGCALGAPPVASPSAKPATASVKASARPSAKPSAQATKKPLALPERVNLLLPPALGMVAAGAGNLIGLDGGTLIGNDAGSLVAAGAGNLIGADGASMVAAGSGNAVKTEAKGLRLAQAADCTPLATGRVVFPELVETNLKIYALSVLIANQVLRQVREANIEPDVPLTLPLAMGGKFTALLKSGETGGVLLVADGEAFDRAKVFLGVTFDSATHGRVVCRPMLEDDTWGRVALVSEFDLATGEATADGASFRSIGDAGPAKTRAHWEFRAPRQATAGTPNFTVHMAAHLDFQAFPCESGVRAMSIHFGADGRGAARMGRVEPGKPDLTFTRNDAVGYLPEPGPNTAFFIGTDSRNIDASAADAALAALLPQATDIYRPFPPTPGAGDPLADPLFAIPE